MSDDAKWVIGIGVPILALLVGCIWAMLNRRIDAEVKVLWDQVGRDSNSGMRKTVHDSSNRSTEALLTCGDHERRVERLERKVFNGHREG